MPLEIPTSTWNVLPEAVHRWRLAEAKASALAGNPRQLRKLYPEIAEFIFAPPRKQGQRRRAADWDMLRLRLQQGLDDVKRIRLLWQKYFGKTYRKASDEATAISIAAQRHDLTLTQLLSFRKNQHRTR